MRVIPWIAIGMILATANYDPEALQKFSSPIVIGVICMGIPISFGFLVVEVFLKCKPHVAEEEIDNVVKFKNSKE